MSEIAMLAVDNNWRKLCGLAQSLPNIRQENNLQRLRLWVVFHAEV
jgi:hypothetical protein